MHHGVVEESPPPLIQRKRINRAIALAMAAVAAGVLIYAGALTLVWPFSEADLIQALQQRSLRKVTIGRFYQTYFPPGCVAENIKFLRIKHPEKPPLLSVQKLQMRAGLADLLLFRRRLSSVSVVGLHLLVPAKEPQGEPSPVMPLTYTDSKNPITIAVISASGAVLDFESQIKGKPPLRLIVNDLLLHNVGAQPAIPYQTHIRTFEPLGDISSNGSFGPWNPSMPETTPVRGSFNYSNVNLASLPGSTGMLQSNGTFQGALGSIEANGKATVASFRINGTSHSRNLNVDYHAKVDATKGDVTLDGVQASFNRTVLQLTGSVAGGSVAGSNGQSGKTVDLTAASDHARVEDLFDLFITSDHPCMTGNVVVRGHMTLPPGPGAFQRRMLLRATFGVDDGLFADKSTERELAKLSVSSIKGDKEEDREDPQTVLSDVKGTLHSAAGVARLDHLRFVVPGATATMHGTFDLTSYNSDMEGVLVTNGDISDVATGAKSLLIKVLTPFFKRQNHSKVVPFKMTGPYGNVSISLDLHPQKKPD